MNVHGTRPTAEQVIDRDTQAVLLDLGPNAASIITDLCIALGRSNRAHVLTLLAHQPRTSREATQLVASVLAQPGVAEAFTLTLGVDHAEALAQELDEATAAVDTCDRQSCDNLADSDGLLCTVHRDQVDLLARAV